MSLVLVLVIILSVIIITGLINSRCKVPDDNKCSRTTSGEDQVPYCESPLGDPVCKPVSEVCGDSSSACQGKIINYCDYKNKKWVCKEKSNEPSGTGSGTGSGSGSGTGCELDAQGNLPYPQAWGGVIHSESLKPVNNSLKYKQIEISSVLGCALDSCKDGFKPSEDGSFCVGTDMGSACDTGSYGQKPGDKYSGYPDPNANWKITYAYPDGETKLCEFDGCKDNYTYSNELNKCVPITKPCPDKKPDFAGPNTQCVDGKYYVTECVQNGNVKYVPNSTNDGCVVGSCVNTCGRKDANPPCVLDPKNPEDVLCSVFGVGEGDKMGQEKTAILQYVMGNVYEKDGVLYASPATSTNPWGGCGNQTLYQYIVNPRTNKCERSFESQSFQYSPWGSQEPGCKECPALTCPRWATKPSDCINWKEGCERVEITGPDGQIANWDIQCKSKYTPPKGISWGDISGGYLPLKREYYYFPSINFKQRDSSISVVFLDANGKPAPVDDEQPFNQVMYVKKLENVKIPKGGFIRIFAHEGIKGRTCYTFPEGDDLEMYDGKSFQLSWNGNNWYFNDVNGGPQIRPRKAGHDHSPGRCFGGGFTEKTTR